MVINEEITERSGMRTIDAQVGARSSRWLGHVLRMPSDRNSKRALTWTPEGKRRRGQPREKQRRTINKEGTYLGFRTWRKQEYAKY